MSTVSSDRLTAAVSAFARERRWLLPALHAAQRALGWLPQEALLAVAAHLRVPASEVHGVASAYPEFRLQPRGRHHVRVCTGVSCALAGGAALLDAVARQHGVTPGETGAERELTLEVADCFFQCAMAPLVEVDGELHGRVTVDAVGGLADWFAYGRRHAARPEVAGLEPARPPARPATASAREFLAGLVDAAGRQPRRALRLAVQIGTCGRAVGADDLLRAVRGAVRARGLDASVAQAACNGACWAAPALTLSGHGLPHAAIERVGPAQVPALLDAIAAGGDLGAAGFTGVAWTDAAWRGLAPAASHPFWGGQERVLLARCGAVDPTSLDDALLAGAYAALASALDGPPEAVIESVEVAGLHGRGGAFFPAALKWKACRAAHGEPRYVVLNGEEGEPGIFKDRHLMEGDPHQVLEGVLLAAYAAGATRAILYIHGEADLAAARLERALMQAEAAGIVGARVLGRDVACHVEIRRGAGGFVLGEETALLESIEGRRAQPRTRPPFPVESGLWGRPTVINNVETLSAVPAIVARGGAWFAALGTERAPGTKVFGLSGPLRRPGVVETRQGVTLAHLLQGIGGGSADGRPLLGAVVGGPSGSVVPAALFDVAMEPRGRVSPGTGGIVAVPAGASVAGIVKTLVAFNARESCGKCTPCREGLPRLLALVDALAGSAEDEARAVALAETVQLASLCGLGQAAPIALLRGLEAFGADFRAPR
jgi:NADH:ubiquinone oxidoreductase subunit F (NADH-binding)/NADH:ubiquinone oxidoreductase subunit E